MDSSEVRIQYQYASALYAQGQYGEALAILEALLVWFPENADIQFARARTLFHLGRHDECLAACDALVAASNHPGALDLKHRTLAAAGQSFDATIPADAPPPPKPTSKALRRRVLWITAALTLSCAAAVFVWINGRERPAGLPGTLSQPPQERTTADPVPSPPAPAARPGNAESDSTPLPDLYQLSDAEAAQYPADAALAGTLFSQGIDSLLKAAVSGNVFDSATGTVLVSDVEAKKFREIAGKLDPAKQAERAQLLQAFVAIFGEARARRIGLRLLDEKGKVRYIWPPPSTARSTENLSPQPPGASGQPGAGEPPASSGRYWRQVDHTCMHPGESPIAAGKTIRILPLTDEPLVTSGSTNGACCQVRFRGILLEPGKDIEFSAHTLFPNSTGFSQTIGPKNIWNKSEPSSEIVIPCPMGTVAATYSGSGKIDFYLADAQSGTPVSNIVEFDITFN